MSLNLKDIEWREFYLKDIFIEIQRGKRLKKNDHFHGEMPYISSSGINNAVDNFVNNKEKVRIFDDCMTIANSGSVGASFYHPYRFVASDHVTKLKNKNFNKYIYLFIASIVARLSEKYGFNREINDKRIIKEKILLPITKDGKPNYKYMETYIQKKEEEKQKRYQAYISKRIDALKDTSNVISLKEKEWGEFLIGDIFRLEAGKSKGLNHLEKVDDGINYLGATNLNNGVLCQVKKVDNMVQNGNGIAFIRNGEGSMGYSVYKEESFIATSDISVGYNRNLNRHVGLFITTIADGIRGKYNFGYKRSSTRLKKETLILPINDNKEPDYEYMETYMKNAEYKKLQKYMTYLERQNTMTIQATKKL